MPRRPRGRRPRAPPSSTRRWLLAQLLNWHRREEKSFWWRFFYLMIDLTDEELIAEREPIGGLELVGQVGEGPRSTIYRYRFPEQEHEIEVGTDVRDPATGRSPGSVDAIDEAAGTIDLRRGEKTDGPHPRSLVPCNHVGTRALQDSLLRDRGVGGGARHRWAVPGRWPGLRGGSGAADAPPAPDGRRGAALPGRARRP